jgi:hypothetical protein
LLATGFSHFLNPQVLAALAHESTQLTVDGNGCPTKPKNGYFKMLSSLALTIGVIDAKIHRVKYPVSFQSLITGCAKLLS